jgi:glycosyltransferase involved in cell wall biosynthesis
MYKQAILSYNVLDDEENENENEKENEDSKKKNIDILINFMQIPIKKYPLTDKDKSQIKKDITFIIPSIGRPTLKRTLLSLQNLNIKDWKAIVVFDGVEQPCQNIVDDERITYTRIDKIGTLNHGGNVRNHGIKMSTTTWVGFVDDDDTLTSDYLDEFYDLSNQYDPDVILFRMKNGNTIIPTIGTQIIENGNVGISFCMKKCDIYFVPSSVEDYFLLKNLNDQNKSIIVSDKVCYMVNC